MSPAYLFFIWRGSCWRPGEGGALPLCARGGVGAGYGGDGVGAGILECWALGDTMDMTDWARLLLAGSLETELRRR